MDATSSTQEKNSIAGIQYLRGLAALMVVFFHSRSYFGVVPEWTRLGSRGVDIFFCDQRIYYGLRHAQIERRNVTVAILRDIFRQTFHTRGSSLLAGIAGYRLPLFYRLVSHCDDIR